MLLVFISVNIQPKSRPILMTRFNLTLPSTYRAFSDLNTHAHVCVESGYNLPNIVRVD